MSEVKTKITIAQLLFMQSQNLLFKTRTTLFITKVISSFWKWQLLYYSSASQFFTDFGAHFVETQARFQQACEPFLLTEQY